MKAIYEKRLWSRVDICGPDDCWEWLAGKSLGYGRIWINKNVYHAHRVLYELMVAPIPDGLFVLHHCDNPGCVNPKHLFIGNQADNMADASRKGRVAKGELNGRSKLTNAQIISIREEYAQGNIRRMELADKYNTTYSNIGFIVRRKKWKNI